MAMRKISLAQYPNFDTHLDKYLTTLEIRLRDVSDEHLLETPNEALADALVRRIDIPRLVINTEKVVRFRPQIVDTRRGKRELRRFRVPATGDTEALQYRPNASLIATCELEIDDEAVEFVLDTTGQDAKQIGGEYDHIIDVLKKQTININTSIEEYGGKLRQHALEIVDRRRKAQIREAEIGKSLSIPIIESPNSKGYAIPLTKKDIPVFAPSGSSRPEPEPHISEGVYQSILRLIFAWGKAMERHPSIYEGKDEEALRDLFLLMLTAHFENSVTGETFNREGRTDILIKYEGRNAFVAECKFWDGEKSLLGAVDQLLDYLTWRDSKSALLVFVKSKAIGEIGLRIKNAPEKHGNHVLKDKASAEGWENYRFHLPGDRERQLNLAVMVFHFPSR